MLADWALGMAREHDVRAILASQEPTILTLADRYDDLAAAGLVMTFPPPQILATAFDKRLTLDAARSAQVPIPATMIPTSVGEIEHAASEIGYPVVLKAPRSYERRGGSIVRLRGPWYASTAAELHAILDGLPEDHPMPIVQRFVAGVGIGLSLLLDRDGVVRAEFAHRRLRDIDPRGSASVVRMGIPIDPVLRQMSLRLLRQMGWWGVAMVEFKMNERTGELTLMEVNGRFWGSLQLAVDSGVDFPRLLLEVAEGARIGSPVPVAGRRLRWWLGDLASTLRVLKGPPRGFPGRFPGRRDAIRSFLAPGRGTRNEVFRWDDPMPAAVEVLDALAHRRH
jgi:predicted ATP-grasp superfamily ATP-dependent carboligase